MVEVNEARRGDSARAAVELIEKAMEGVTPGKWESEHGSAYGPVMSYNVSANARKVLSPVVCHIVDHLEAKANAAYIAACSPDRMREVLAAASEAEALKREIAELRDSLSDVLELAERQWANPEELSEIRRARALLSKESAEQDGSAIKSSGTGGGDE